MMQNTSSSNIDGVDAGVGESTTKPDSMKASNKKGFLAYIEFLPSDRFSCSICDVKMSSWKNAVSHIVGSRHVENLMAINPREISLGNKLKMEFKQSFVGDTSSAVPSNNVTQSVKNQMTYPHIMSSTIYSCNICNITNLKSWHDVESHVKGISHAESMKLKEEKKANVTSHTPQPSHQSKPAEKPINGSSGNQDKSEKTQDVKTNSNTAVSARDESPSTVNQGQYPHIVTISNGVYSCKVCNIPSIYSWHDVECHINGRRHAESLEIAGERKSTPRAAKQGKLSQEVLPHIEELDNGFFACVLCDTGDITCWKNVLGHINGLRHKQQLNQAGSSDESCTSTSSTEDSAQQTNSTCPYIQKLSNGKYVCTICETGGMHSWDDVQCHINGNRHAIQLADSCNIKTQAAPAPQQSYSQPSHKDNPHIESLDNGKFYCVTCDTGDITSWDDVICHLNGRRHQEQTI